MAADTRIALEHIITSDGLPRCIRAAALERRKALYARKGEAA